MTIEILPTSESVGSTEAGSAGVSPASPSPILERGPGGEAAECLSVEALLARLRLLAPQRDHRAEVAALLVQLKSSVNGQFASLLRQIRPDITRPDAWAKKLMSQSSVARGVAPPPPAPRPPDQRPTGPVPQTAGPTAPVSPPGATGAAEAGYSAPRALDDRAARLYPRLRPLLEISGAARREAIDALAADLGVSRGTVYANLSRLSAAGGAAAALCRKKRSDAGEIKLPKEVHQAFLDRRLDKHTRREAVAVTIHMIQRQFPGLDISAHSLRRVAANLPAALTMEDREWRAKFGTVGFTRWETPGRNHTHVFDMTIADLFVWDRNPDEKPYRPRLTAIIDEHTQSCLWGLYTEEEPNISTLQGVLLHGWLKKDDPQWCQYGLPEHLHCDNGKIQISGWLQDVCRSLGAELHDWSDEQLRQALRHTKVRSPWQDGHIERFYGLVHTHFEQAYFPGAYCGRSPQHRPEGFKGNEGSPKDWAGYPTLESLNVAFRLWIPTDYHERKHSRLGVSRTQAWLFDSQRPVRAADRDDLHHRLLQRTICKVARSTVRVNNGWYWHAVLEAYEGNRLQVRWDGADYSYVIVLDAAGERVICRAERQVARNVDNPKDLGEHKRQQRELKQMRQVLAESVRIAPSLNPSELQQHLAELGAAHESQGLIPFVNAVKVTPLPPDPMTADEALILVGAASAAGSAGVSPASDDEKLTAFGIEI